MVIVVAVVVVLVGTGMVVRSPAVVVITLAVGQAAVLLSGTMKLVTQNSTGCCLEQ